MNNHIEFPQETVSTFFSENGIAGFEVDIYSFKQFIESTEGDPNDALRSKFEKFLDDLVENMKFYKNKRVVN